MESEDSRRGIAPAVLVCALLLLSLVPAQALGQEWDGEASLLQPQMLDGPTPVGDEPEPGPVDILDVKEVISGRIPGEAFGGQTAGIGDVDNDGYDDIGVLVPARGLAVVYQGGPQIHEAPVHPLEGTPYVLTGQSQVRPAGDIDFDGFDDVLITAPDYYVGTMRAAGALLVFYGSPSGLREEPDQAILGTEKDMRLGSDVDTVGDINGDGYSDVLVGADGWHSDTGIVLLFLGGPDGLSDDPTWIWTGEAVGDRFGHAVTGAGDINADGIPDFAVGAPFASSGEGKGKVYFYYGTRDLAKLEVGTTISGRMLKSYFGLSIKLAGDVNNDGFSDLIISAPEDPSGPHLKAGKVELYLGRETGIDTSPKWVLQGESDDALLGFTIAFLGDVNRDGYDDVAIGAPSHTADGKAQRGKFYIFLGDRSGFRDYPSVVELGEEAGDHLSMGLAGAGDVDGDGFRDVLVGAPGADTAGGIDSGELHIYRGSDLTMPPLLSDAFEVVDPTEGDLMLVEHRPYKFRLSVTHRTGFGALDHVDLHLDPEGVDVVYRFHVETQNLFELRDENDLAEGTYIRPVESSVYMDTTDIMLSIMLHWGFPSGRPLSVRMEVTDSHGLRNTGRWSDTARVVDRLDFSNTITVLGDDQGQLEDGDWIAASEGLSFTGALVLYDLAYYGVETDVTYFPPDGKLKAVVRDDLGGMWSSPVLMGKPIAVHALAPGSSRPEMTYSLSIENLDQTKVFRTQQFVLNVDGTGVSFKNPEPSATISNIYATATIEIEDPLGPGVDHTSVEYRLDRPKDEYANIFENRNWSSAHNVAVLSDGSVVADVQEAFGEGRNYIQWRAKDRVGNGFVLSPIYPIVVDLGNITFTNPFPLPTKWHRTGSVAVGVTIQSSAGNPIDLNNIEYRITTSPGTYTKWTKYGVSVPPGSDQSRVVIMTNERFSEGETNFIQWRARDLVKREMFTSPLYRVLVDMSGPVFSPVSPSEAEFIGTRDVTVTVLVEDSLSGTMDSSIAYQVLGEDEDVWHTPLSKSHRGDVFECTARVTLEEGVENYIRWRAEDMVGHSSEAFDQQILVDTQAPTFSDFLPRQGSVVTSRFVEVSIRVSDNGQLGMVSGVDLRTLQYTIDRPQSGQSAWTTALGGVTVPVVPFQTINLVLEVEEGDNRLVWRVQDAVGNELRSEPYQILADLPDPGNRAPVVIITEPSVSRIDYDQLLVVDARNSWSPVGERLRYEWTSDLDGLLGDSPSFSTPLSEGLHTITLRVTGETTGLTSVETIYVMVEPPEEPKTPFSTLWEQLALALILVFVLITLLLQRFRIKEWEL